MLPFRVPPAATPAAPAGWGRRHRGVHVHVLQVHRVEAAGVLQEVLGPDKARGDGGHLELELHQRRIDPCEQQVVRPPAVDGRDLEPFVVQALLHPAFAAAAAVFSMKSRLDSRVIGVSALRLPAGRDSRMRKAFASGTLVILAVAASHRSRRPPRRNEMAAKLTASQIGPASRKSP